MDPYLISAIVALAGAVAILWKRSDASLSWLRKAYDDIVIRVRKLEDDRIITERTHNADVKALAKSMLASRAEDRKVTRELIQGLRKMPCKRELVPHQIEDETITIPLTKKPKTKKGTKPCKTSSIGSAPTARPSSPSTAP